MQARVDLKYITNWSTALDVRPIAYGFFFLARAIAFEWRRQKAMWENGGGIPGRCADIAQNKPMLPGPSAEP
jgi:hypothetical protein